MNVDDVVEYQGDNWTVTWIDGEEAEITNCFGGSMFVDVEELTSEDTP